MAQVKARAACPACHGYKAKSACYQCRTGAPSYAWLHLASLPKGSTLRTILRTVGRSGMSRTLDLLHIAPDGSVSHLRAPEHHAYTPEPARRAGAYKVGGCGFDAGFQVVYDLGYAIHGDGYYFRHEWL
jgi:hypothetical protein